MLIFNVILVTYLQHFWWFWSFTPGKYSILSYPAWKPCFLTDPQACWGKIQKFGSGEIPSLLYHQDDWWDFLTSLYQCIIHIQLVLWRSGRKQWNIRHQSYTAPLLWFLFDMLKLFRAWHYYGLYDIFFFHSLNWSHTDTLNSTMSQEQVTPDLYTHKNVAYARNVWISKSPYSLHLNT